MTFVWKTWEMMRTSVMLAIEKENCFWWKISNTTKLQTNVVSIMLNHWKEPSQPHFPFAWESLAFMEHVEITMKLLKIIKLTFRNTTYRKAKRFCFTMQYYQFRCGGGWLGAFEIISVWIVHYWYKATYLQRMSQNEFWHNSWTFFCLLSFDHMILGEARWQPFV